MTRPLRRRPSLPTLIASLALFVALGGPAEAKRLIDGKDIRRGTVSGPQIKDRSLDTRELSSRATRWLRQTPTGTINATKLAAGAVTAPKLSGGSVTGATVADQSIGAADLAPGSIGSDKIAENAVGQAAIRANGVAASEIADDSIDGGEVVNGGLDAADVGKFVGNLRVVFGEIAGGKCASVPARGLAADQANVDISDDLITISPAAGWPPARLSYGVEPGPENDVFSVVACNPLATEPVPLPGPVTFRYAVFDL